MQSGHNDPDVWFDKKFVRPDFKLDASPATQSICVPADAVYNVDLTPIWIYSQPVSLTVESGQRAGSPRSASTRSRRLAPAYSPWIRAAGAAGSYNLVVVGQPPSPRRMP